MTISGETGGPWGDRHVKELCDTGGGCNNGENCDIDEDCDDHVICDTDEGCNNGENCDNDECRSDDEICDKDKICGDTYRRCIIPVTRPAPLPESELIPLWREILRSRRYTNFGPMYRRLQRRLEDYCGVSYVIPVSSGHQALQLSIEGLRLHENHIWREVITSPFTFLSTTEAILREGMIPVFADVDPTTGCLSPSSIEEHLTAYTAAILPIHVYGHICDNPPIEALAKQYHLPVIYDAAHAFGETVACTQDMQQLSAQTPQRLNTSSENPEAGHTYSPSVAANQSEPQRESPATESTMIESKSVMSLGTLSCCSFHATKVFTTGEGGAIFCKDPDLAKRIEALTNFGIRDGAFTNLIGTNVKLDEFRSTIGLVSLAHFKETTHQRQQRYLRYCENLAGLCGIYVFDPAIRFRGCNVQKVYERIDTHDECDDVGGNDVCNDDRRDVYGQSEDSSEHHYVARLNYGYMPVLITEESNLTRDEVCDWLLANGIETRKYFYPLTSEHPGVRRRIEDYRNNIYGFREPYDPTTETPNAFYLSRHILCLPLYADLPLDEVDRISSLIIHLYRKANAARTCAGAAQLREGTS